MIIIKKTWESLHTQVFFAFKGEHMKTEKDRWYSFNHTKERLLERYDIDISNKDYDYLCTKIINNDGITTVMIEEQDNDIQYTYDVDFKYKATIRLVWSAKRQCITTALKRI